MKDELVNDVPQSYQDNTSMILLVAKGGGKPWTIHIRVRVDKVREHLDREELEIKYAKTSQMIEHYSMG